MEKINSDAWDLLNQDEKTSLTLSLSFNKSTWEAGEIMKKAHFKYLEIQKRARKFLEIFTNHFHKYGNLFPEDVHISFAFKEYLQLTMLERKNISRAVKSMENTGYTVASFRNKLIIEEIYKLQRCNTDGCLDLYGLIMDFDRWNNFRILPLEVQEPSAFKRRNKARNLKHLNKITSLPKFSVLKLIDRYSYSGKYDKAYLPIISGYLDNDYKVIEIRNKNTIINNITGIGLFVFSDRAIAIEFANLISGYFIHSIKNCKTGQKFWPEFRVFITEAINYRELENIHKSRIYLDHAIHNTDHLKIRKRKEKPQLGEKRLSDKELNSI